MEIQGYDFKEKYLMCWDGDIEYPEAKAYTFDKLLVSPQFSYVNKDIKGYMNIANYKSSNVVNIFQDPIKSFNMV